MRKIKLLLSLIIISNCILSSCANKPADETVDICIYGGTSAGVIAAYTAKKAGKTVLLIEPGKHLGGMTSAGLGQTDIGNKYVVTGLALDFYRRVGSHYGNLENWTFEPKVAEEVFNQYIKEGDVNVWYEKRIIKAKTKNKNIEEITLEDSTNPQKSTRKIVKAKMFIDCSYEGDLMAKAGVSYTIGREANAQYNETYNGVELMDKHQFPDSVDPYVIKGDPKSGLLYGINSKPVLANGTGDKKVQAYNYRITLTNNPENMIPITEPENYDPKKYELLIRIKEVLPWKSKNDAFIWSIMPNNKTDINNRGGFSTDMIGENWNYPEASYEERSKIIKAHEDYTKGLLYFVGNDSRIPDSIRNEFKTWGYPKDEYLDNNHFSHQLYIRECRRMIGEAVMTQHHCVAEEVVNDAVGWAAYTMDSHNCDRHVVNGMVKNEGNVEIGGFNPYPVGYGSIIPKRTEITNLIVPVCLSASHIAYGSIRMEPVFMVLAQSGALAACQAIDKNIIIQDVNVPELQALLKSNPKMDGSTPEIIMDNNDENGVTMTGDWILKKVRFCYGINALIDSLSKKGQVEKNVRYTPQIKTAGNYEVYMYVTSVKNPTDQMNVSVFDGSKIIPKTIIYKDLFLDHSSSRGGWISLGIYNLPEGEKAYFEITNKGANNVLVADAVLFKPI